MWVMKVYIDVSFAAHEGMKFHIRLVLKFGQGYALEESCKQHLKTQNRTIIDLVAVEDFIGMVWWKNWFWNLK